MPQTGPVRVLKTVFADVATVSAGVHLWHRYDASCRSEVWSTALEIDGSTWLIDPSAIDAEQLATLPPLAGVIVSNENHLRESFAIARRSAVPIYTQAEFETEGVAVVRDLPAPLAARFVPIAGAAAGEVAVYSVADHGTVIIGDALINFEPYGFTFLPAKYCSDHKLMRRSLHQLLDLDFDRMLFGHGTPIISRARERLQALLES